MTWFKVDDSFHSHPKILATEPAALGLWVVAGAWSSSNLTDGFVPDHVLSRLFPDAAKLADSLRKTGLWHRKKGGYQFHDWTDYNPTKTEVEGERKAARDRMKTLRANRRSAGQSGNRSGEQPANVREKFVTPDPTRPSRPDPEDQDPPVVPPQSKAKATGRRGTRLPDDFAVTAEMVEWARAETPGVDGRYETAKFVDYWRGKTGQAATKLDWLSTWRNWMRKAQEDLGPARRAPTTDDKVTGFVERGRRLQALQEQGQIDSKELTA